MCGPVMAFGKKVAGATLAGIPGALIGASMDKKRERKKQRFGDGTTVDGAMSFSG